MGKALLLLEEQYKRQGSLLLCLEDEDGRVRDRAQCSPFLSKTKEIKGQGSLIPLVEEPNGQGSQECKRQVSLLLFLENIDKGHLSLLLYL